MFYEYKKEAFPYEERFIEETPCFRHCQIKFPSYFKTSDPVNDTVYLDCFLPGDFKSLLIILPGLGMGPSQAGFIAHFAKKLAQDRIGACILTLPYHRERTPQGFKSGEYFLNTEVNKALDFFQQAVSDVMRTVDFWQDNFNIESLSIMGVSLGSIISIISMARDKRIKKGIFMLSGGNFSKLLWDGSLRFLTKKDCTRRECRDNYRQLKARKGLENFDDIHALKFPRDCVYYEPIVFAALLKEKRVLMFNALFDYVVPFGSTIEIWNALGRPKIHWLPAEHYSVFIFSPLILSKVKDFLS